jgi:hypothetical protein
VDGCSRPAIRRRGDHRLVEDSAGRLAHRPARWAAALDAAGPRHGDQASFRGPGRPRGRDRDSAGPYSSAHRRKIVGDAFQRLEGSSTIKRHPTWPAAAGPQPGRPSPPRRRRAPCPTWPAGLSRDPPGPAADRWPGRPAAEEPHPIPGGLNQQPSTSQQPVPLAGPPVEGQTTDDEDEHPAGTIRNHHGEQTPDEDPVPVRMQLPTPRLPPAVTIRERRPTRPQRGGLGYVITG